MLKMRKNKNDLKFIARPFKKNFFLMILSDYFIIAFHYQICLIYEIK